MYRWAPHFRDSRIYIFSDNSVTVNAINKGTSRNNTIRSLFWLSACFTFQIVARHIPGINNDRTDAVSRLHELSTFSKVMLSLYQPLSVRDLSSYMSSGTLLSLLHRHFKGEVNQGSGQHSGYVPF